MLSASSGMQPLALAPRFFMSQDSSRNTGAATSPASFATRTATTLRRSVEPTRECSAFSSDSTSSLHCVVNEGGVRRLTDAAMLELHHIRESFEETLAPAEHQRCDDHRKFVDEPCSQGLSDHVGAAHHVHLPFTRGIQRQLDRLG